MGEGGRTGEGPRRQPAVGSSVWERQGKVEPKQRVTRESEDKARQWDRGLSREEEHQR